MRLRGVRKKLEYGVGPKAGDEELAANHHVAARPYPGLLTIDAAQDAVSLTIVASVGPMCLQLGSPRIRRRCR